MDKGVCDNCSCPLNTEIGWTYYDRLPFLTSQLPRGKSGIVCNDCNDILGMFITMVDFEEGETR
jgi:hypothetical protein